MTWEIFLGIAALVAFVISIGKIVKSNTEVMTEIKVTLQEARSDINTQDSKIEKLDTKVQNHENRITILEQN